MVWVHIGIALMRQFQCSHISEFPCAHITEKLRKSKIEIYTYQV